MKSNLYFALTEEFNAEGFVAVLSSGQATVFHRIAIMSKDGDWILEESERACRRVLKVLEGHRAHYRLGAPLDLRWLSGGWSSHFEFFDAESRRIRCDFVSHPPRLSAEERLAALANSRGEGGLRVIDVEALIALKRTQRIKDYAVITELARLLPEDRELELSFDPERILELAPKHGASTQREAARLAFAGAGREAVVVALAREADHLQMADRVRLEAYSRAGQRYAEEFQRSGIGALPLPEAHARLVELAQLTLPKSVS